MTQLAKQLKIPKTKASHDSLELKQQRVYSDKIRGTCTRQCTKLRLIMDVRIIVDLKSMYIQGKEACREAQCRPVLISMV